MLDTIELLQGARLQNFQDQAQEAREEFDKRRFLVMLAKEIISAINDKTINRIEEGVDVNNFDEITAALRNELNRANKPIVDIIRQLDSTVKAQTKILVEAISIMNIEVNVPATVVNIPEIKMPEINFEPLVKELEHQLKILRTNNKSHPLAVRLSTGGDWIRNPVEKEGD